LVAKTPIPVVGERAFCAVVPASTEPGRLVQVLAATLNSVGGFLFARSALQKGDQRAWPSYYLGSTLQEPKSVITSTVALRKSQPNCKAPQAMTSCSRPNNWQHC
jgi:hypothetical protein